MFMTMEKIPAPDHPALRAARTIRQMHVDTIAKIDGGFVFYKDGEDGVKHNVNDQMREACSKQIELCDEIIEHSDKIPPELREPLELKLEAVHKELSARIDSAVKESTEEPLPEIGNYDHKENG